MNGPWGPAVGLRQHRKAAGLRLRDVAELVGLSINYIAEIERGMRQPPADTAARIAGALGFVAPPPLPQRMPEGYLAVRVADLEAVLPALKDCGALSRFDATTRASFERLASVVWEDDDDE